MGKGEMYQNPTTETDVDSLVNMINKNNLTVQGVVKNSWADKFTKLGEYIGCVLIKVNGTSVSTKQDLVLAKNAAAGLENAIFTLQGLPQSQKLQNLIHVIRTKKAGRQSRWH